jgi:hypothetical protein
MCLRPGLIFSRPQDTVPVREKARRTIVERYDLKTICLPRQIELVKNSS